jgi:hypothetical protein
MALTSDCGRNPLGDVYLCRHLCYCFYMVLICANDPPGGGFFVVIAVTGGTGRVAADGTD